MLLNSIKINGLLSLRDVELEMRPINKLYVVTTDKASLKTDCRAIRL